MCRGSHRVAGSKSTTRGWGPSPGCSTTPGLASGKTVEMDPETMKLALRITFGDEKTLDNLFRKNSAPPLVCAASGDQGPAPRVT